MVRFSKHIALLFLLLGSLHSLAQETFTTVQLNRRTVYPGEPIKVTINVYTSTWFTTSLDFSTPAIENALILPFERTVSGVEKRGNKSYAILQFFYQLYPLESGEYVLPEIPISFESPPEGDYKGRPVTVKTKSQKFRVKKEIQKDDTPWFVALKVTASQRLSPRKTTFKQGDLVTRKTTLKAYGTLPLFIPETEWSDAVGAGTYPKSPSFQDKRDDKQANGWRTQDIVYLLKDTGTVVLPEQVVEYYNPYRSRWMKAVFPSKTLKVEANPDLGILETLEDSLSTTTKSIDDSSHSPTLSFKEAVAGLAIGGAALWVFSFVIRFLMWVTKRILPSDRLVLRWKRRGRILFSSSDAKRIHEVYQAFGEVHFQELSLRSHLKGTRWSAPWERAQKEGKLSKSDALGIISWLEKDKAITGEKNDWPLNPN